jgi:NAD(P)-dependent dehydrogenase (short-subunit alcohol dehydrogenase family)
MIRMTQAVLPLFRAQGSGAIVNMSSVMGRKAFARFGSYAIVMHAVSALSDALRQECAGQNITVSVIHPALTDDSGVIAPTIPEISRPPVPGLSRPPVPALCRPPIPELFRPPVEAV